MSHESQKRSKREWYDRNKEKVAFQRAKVRAQLNDKPISSKFATDVMQEMAMKARPKPSLKQANLYSIKVRIADIYDEIADGTAKYDYKIVDGKSKRLDAMISIGRVLLRLYGFTADDEDIDLLPLINDTETTMLLMDAQNITEQSLMAQYGRLLWLLNNVPNFKVSANIYHQYDLKYNDMFDTDILKERLRLEKLNEDRIYRFEDIQKAIYEAYPEGSQERILIDLYGEVPARDNLSLAIQYDGQEAPSDNYISLAKPVTVHIINYKTQRQYGNKHFVLSSKLAERITNLCDDGRKTLFVSPSIKNGKLSYFIKNMFKHTSLQSENIGIKYLRKSLISTKLDEISKGGYPEDEMITLIKKLANDSMHSISVQTKYKVPLKYILPERT